MLSHYHPLSHDLWHQAAKVVIHRLASAFLQLLHHLYILALVLLEHFCQRDAAYLNRALFR